MQHNAKHSPLDGTLITKASFVSDELMYCMCKRCVMDTTDPSIQFDEEGICNHCNRFDQVVKPKWGTMEEIRCRLDLMIKRIKHHGIGKTYDCIIGLSGGVDSSYLAIKLREWGLRPLAVHVDAGWNSELAVNNIEVICKN